MTNYTGVEGEDIEICVTILSPNQSVLAMSALEGNFSISETGNAVSGTSYKTITSSTVYTSCM